MLVVGPKLDVKLAIRLAVAAVYPETVSRGCRAVGRVLWIPAMSKVWAFSALGPTSSAPTTIRPAVVEEAREAGGGEGPVVLWDPKAASLPPFSPAGAPLVKRVPTLNTLVCAASTVRSGQVEPTRTAGVCRGELAVPLLLAGLCRQKVKLVASRLRASLAPSKLPDVLAVVIHLCCAPVLLLAIGVLGAPMAPLTSLDARTRVLNLRPLQHLARLQHPALTVLHRDGAHGCRGHSSCRCRAPWGSSYRLLAVALGLPIIAPLSSSKTRALWQWFCLLESITRLFDLALAYCIVAPEVAVVINCCCTPRESSVCRIRAITLRLSTVFPGTSFNAWTCWRVCFFQSLAGCQLLPLAKGEGKVGGVTPVSIDCLGTPGGASAVWIAAVGIASSLVGPCSAVNTWAGGCLGGVDGEGEHEDDDLHAEQGGGVQDQHLLLPPLPV